MNDFNIGDLVRIDFGNGEHDNINGIFVHDRMRHINERTFHVLHADNVDNRYHLSDEDGDRLPWAFVKEWLTLASVATPTQDEPSQPIQEIEQEMVEDYNGNMQPIERCRMLTEPSEHAGKYASFNDSTRLQLKCGKHIALLDDEVSELVIEISGDRMLKAEVDEDDYVECAGGSCRHENIWRSEATYVEDSGYYHEDDQGEYFWYHDGDGYYTYEPEEQQGATLGYHTTKDNGYVDKTNPDTLFTIGFEVEKEDGDILSEYEPSDLDDMGWAREHDGSLNDETGYELVSPIYDLFDDKLDKAMDNRALKNHINADSTTACGGHINYGKRGMTGAELLKESTAFLPLFLALYRKRVTGRWAKMKVDIGKYDSGDRYVAFNVQHNYIEFRLISRVHDVDTLLWRRDLFRIMANNGGKSVAQVQRMMLDRRNVLHKHLRKMYSEERLLRLVCWYSQFADAMHDTLSVSKTGHGVMLDFFIASLKRIKKRISIGIDDVIGWANEVSAIISRVDGGDKYAENVKPLSCEELKFLGK